MREFILNNALIVILCSAIIAMLLGLLVGYIVAKRNIKKDMLNKIKEAKDEHKFVKVNDELSLDFRTEPWVSERNIIFGNCESLKTKKGKYYLITRRFPTGNRKMEVVRQEGEAMHFPEFTVAMMELNVEPYVGD